MPPTVAMGSAMLAAESLPRSTDRMATMAGLWSSESGEVAVINGDIVE